MEISLKFHVREKLKLSVVVGDIDGAVKVINENPWEISQYKIFYKWSKNQELQKLMFEKIKNKITVEMSKILIPTEKTNFSLNFPTSSSHCEYCTWLADFLRNPNETSKMFRKVRNKKNGGKIISGA